MDGIQICKNFDHAKKIVAANKDTDIKKVVVVGAGYIGVELVDAFVAHGKQVALVDMAPRIMPNYYDKEFTDLMEQRMRDAGVELVLGTAVKEFKGTDNHVTQIVTDQKTIDADFVIFAAGVRPQTEIVKNVVELSPRGAIKTNEFMQTSQKDIYAIGDCAEVFNDATGQSVPIQLATTAVRTGLIAATNIVKKNDLPTPGFTGANGIDVFGLKMSSTGVSLEAAKKLGMEVEHATLEDNDRPEFMSNSTKV
jgi:NADPH-dependent 2,4-dienoyl-CoA reductase/sulfur reductase-like enzyme